MEALFKISLRPKLDFTMHKNYYLIGGFGNQLFQLNEMIYQQSRDYTCNYNTNLLDTYRTKRTFQCYDIFTSFPFEEFKESKFISTSYKYIDKFINLEKIVNRRIGYWQTREISKELLEFLVNYYDYKTHEGILIHIRGTDFLSSEDQVKNLWEFYLINLKRAEAQEQKIYITTDDIKFADDIIQTSGINKEKVIYIQSFAECLGFVEVVSPESTYSTWAALISGSKLIFPEKITSVLIQNESIRKLLK